MSNDVVGLGFAAMDVMLNVESLPQEDGFSFIHGEHLLPGGSCANAMVTVARIGGQACLIAKLGDDHYGQAFIRDLEESGVSTEFLQTKTGGITLHNFIPVAGNGSKIIFSHLGDSLLSLSDSDVTEEMIQGAKVFYNELVPAGPALKLAGICVDQKIPVVFNLQVDPGFMELCGVSLIEIKEMLSLCDLFITNQHFMRQLADKEDCVEAVSHLYDIYSPSLGIIATRGEQGAIFMNDHESLSAPALDIRAVDTTGAGDSFSGGFMYSRFVEGSGIEEAMAFASACAALKCTQPGPRLKAGRADVLEFRRQYNKS